MFETVWKPPCAAITVLILRSLKNPALCSILSDREAIIKI